MGHHEETKAVNHLAMSVDEYKHHKSEVWKTTILLSIVTIVEVVIAIFYERVLIPQGWSMGLLRVFLIVMSLLKAGYIMAVFMHLKHEKTAFILTILVPFTLLIWMIISFVYEGDYWFSQNTKRFGRPEISVREQHKGVEENSAHH